MQFHIADTFTDSLLKLTNDEQKAVKTTAFDLQMNPANPGMQLHPIDPASFQDQPRAVRRDSHDMPGPLQPLAPRKQICK